MGRFKQLLTRNVWDCKRRNSLETTMQGSVSSSRNMHNNMYSRSSSAGTKAPSWAESTHCYFTTNQSEESSHTVEDNEDTDSYPKWLTVINFSFLFFKTFVVKQNPQSWFSGMRVPSLQVPGLLNKATFSLQPTLVSQIWAFEWQAAKHCEQSITADLKKWIYCSLALLLSPICKS